MRAEFKSLAKKNQKENWENFARYVNCNTAINEAWKRVRRLKGRDQKTNRHSIKKAK